MKVFIKRSLVIFALIILAVFFVQALICGEWRNFISMLQIFFVTIIIQLGFFLTNKFHSYYHIFEIGLELIMVLTIVMLSSWLFQWYPLSYSWILFVIVIPVYIVSYMLDIARSKRDVEFINHQIKLRKARMESPHLEKQE